NSERANAPTEVAVALLGETERPDGSWDGVDLVAHPLAPAQRFQVNVRVERRTRFSLDAIEGEDVARLFPDEQREIILEPGRWQPVAAPKSCYALAGRVRLRMNLAPIERFTTTAELAEATGARAPITLRLSDGATFQTTRQTFEGKSRSRVEFDLRAP